MFGVPGDRRGLADAVGIATLGHHHVVGVEAACVGDGERPAFDRVADRTPHLNDGKAAGEQGFGLLAHQIAHPLRRRPLRIIVVHAAHRVSDLGGGAQRVVGGAQSMIEHDDPVGAALGHNQPFHLRVVDPADFILVIKIGHPGRMMDKAKAVLLEREFPDFQSAVAQCDAVLLAVAAAGAPVRFSRGADQGDRQGLGIDKIIEGGVERRGLDLKFGQLDHRGSSKRCLR